MTLTRRLFHCTALLSGLAIWLGVLSPRPALAHTRIEVGPYVLVIGWVKEPVIVGERNAILIQVTEDEAPIEGLEATLQMEILYAGRTFRANLAPEGTPGWYTAEIFPTVRGQYQIRLTGSIVDQPIDETVEPEEVQAGNVLQFPEPQPEPRDLERSLRDVEARLGTAYTLAVAGLAAGVLGVGLAAFSLLRRR
jgi:hypothetical protein